jgi:hypothetical protein
LDKGRHKDRAGKKLHAAHSVRADNFSETEDILVKKSRTYVVIADLSGDFALF